MDNLINSLLQVEHLTSSELEKIKNQFTRVCYSPKEYFLKVNMFSKKIGFIESGVFRIFHIDDKGMEQTRYFVLEEQFAIELNSFYNNVPSDVYIQAETEVIVWEISKENFNDLKITILKFDAIANTITQKLLFDKMVNRSELVNLDAKTKYLGFITKYPNLINQVPLGHVASYLGITQPSLSRIRKEISK